MKITPAHDFNDYQSVSATACRQISILTLDAKISDEAPARPIAASTASTRASACSPTCEAQGLLVSVKPHKLKVPRSGRTGVIVEPMLTDQWFVRMDGLAQAAAWMRSRAAK